jgi:radical SAM superfamily enzyme YgiQ (UPF0313 family)
MKSILLTSIPKYDLSAPPAALGVLQGVAKSNGWQTKIFDFNLFLHKNLTDEEWQAIDNWSMFIINDIDDGLKKKIINLWDLSIKTEMLENTEYLLISIFSYWSLYIARLIISHEGKKIKPYKLIVGGNGVVSKFPDTKEYFEYWNNKNKFIEHLIIGEGENPLVKILSKGRIKYDDENIDSYPFPSYSGFNFNEYFEKKVYITGSRGCVRKCTFCDIANIWPKFRYRSAESIIEEIKKHFYEHGITRFDFTDSLINGSVSNFYKFNCLLAEEKQKNAYLKDIIYLGQAICRPKNQMLEKHYEAMYYAGCKQLTIGIESFSSKIREHMKKRFSDKDIEYHLEQCAIWNIPNIFLMICGYPTETIEDHNKNLQDLKKYQLFANMGVIEMIRWGTTMHLIPDTPITSQKSIQELGLISRDSTPIFFSPKSSYDWISKINPELTIKERIRRRIELHETTTRLGYLQPRVKEDLNTLLSLAKSVKINN